MVKARMDDVPVDTPPLRARGGFGCVPMVGAEGGRARPHTGRCVDADAALHHVASMKLPLTLPSLSALPAALAPLKALPGLKLALADLTKARRTWVTPAGAGPSDTGKLEDVTEFGANPGALRMLRFVPPGLPPGAPLVVVLHGCTQTASGLRPWQRLVHPGRAARLRAAVSGAAAGEQTTICASTGSSRRTPRAGRARSPPSPPWSLPPSQPCTATRPGCS